MRSNLIIKDRVKYYMSHFEFLNKC